MEIYENMPLDKSKGFFGTSSRLFSCSAGEPAEVGKHHRCGGDQKSSRDFREQNRKTATIDLALLEQPQPFQRLRKMFRLCVEFAEQSIRWKRILCTLAALPQVEQLVIAGCREEQETCVVKEHGNLLVGAQELELENLSAESLVRLLKEMPNLIYLHVKYYESGESERRHS